MGRNRDSRNQETQELIQVLVTENLVLTKSLDKVADQNEKLLSYIIFFHEQMEELSNKMEAKTQELMGDLLKLIKGTEGVDGHE